MPPASILIADHDAASRSRVANVLQRQGYTVVEAEDNTHALAELKRAPCRFDAVLLQREAGAGSDGMDVLGKIKAHPVLKLLPVIMQSESRDERDMNESLRAGAHYYLARPLDEELLLAVMKTAVSDHANYRHLQRQVEHCEGKLTHMLAGHFQVRTLEEASVLGKLLSSAYPDSDLVVVGITELLINAVEHGNLEIGYQKKSELIASSQWQEEVERRLTIAPYASRRVDVMFQRQPGEIRLNIKDQGKGFDWLRYLEIHPDRVYDTHGRGIAIARQVSFDELDYLGDGNEVEAVNYYPETENDPLDDEVEEY